MGNNIPDWGQVTAGNSSSGDSLAIKGSELMTRALDNLSPMITKQNNLNKSNFNNRKAATTDKYIDEIRRGGKPTIGTNSAYDLGKVNNAQWDYDEKVRKNDIRDEISAYQFALQNPTDDNGVPIDANKNPLTAAKYQEKVMAAASPDVQRALMSNYSKETDALRNADFNQKEDAEYTDFMSRINNAKSTAEINKIMGEVKNPKVFNKLNLMKGQKLAKWKQEQRDREARSDADLGAQLNNLNALYQQTGKWDQTAADAILMKMTPSARNAATSSINKMRTGVNKSQNEGYVQDIINNAKMNNLPLNREALASMREGYGPTGQKMVDDQIRKFDMSTDKTADAISSAKSMSQLDNILNQGKITGIVNDDDVMKIISTMDDASQIKAMNKLNAFKNNLNATTQKSNMNQAKTEFEEGGIYEAEKFSDTPRGEELGTAFNTFADQNLDVTQPFVPKSYNDYAKDVDTKRANLEKNYPRYTGWFGMNRFRDDIFKEKLNARRKIMAMNLPSVEDRTARIKEAIRDIDKKWEDFAVEIGLDNTVAKEKEADRRRYEERKKYVNQAGADIQDFFRQEKKKYNSSSKAKGLTPGKTKEVDDIVQTLIKKAKSAGRPLTKQQQVDLSLYVKNRANELSKAKNKSRAEAKMKEFLRKAKIADELKVVNAKAKLKQASKQDN